MTVCVSTPVVLSFLIVTRNNGGGLILIIEIGLGFITEELP
jgi:hypothetical protein